MARTRKENMNTSFFHIMVQGNNKENIFNSLKDTEKYMRIMKDTKEKINMIILAYCMMRNHAHILFYEKDIENLTKYMHRVNLLYAKYYNKKYNRVGYVFRDRYKTQPIYSEKHLQACVRYIHNNPVKANICKKANQYKYSSCCNNIFYTDTELERNIKKNMNLLEPISNQEQNFILMEDDQNKEQIGNEIIKEIITKNDVTKEELIQDEKLINFTIKRLKIENNMSYRRMETILGIDRKKLREIEKKQEEMNGGIKIE